MADVMLPNGVKLLKNDRGQAIVWLPLNVEVSLDVRGEGDLEAPMKMGDPDQRTIRSDTSGNVSITNIYKSFQGLSFTLKASVAGEEHHSFFNRNGTRLGSFVTVAGNVKNHKGMDIDLVADLIGRGDPAKILAVQHLLLSSSNNIFDQNNAANEEQYGHLACGKVVNGSGKSLFGSMSPIFYEHPYHEPLSKVTNRSDVKYQADKMFKVRTSIKGYLAKGTPVRVGVLDAPIGMYVQNRKLVAYYRGGHTTLIVGCDNAASRFLYIDTWPGGSQLKYEGGIGGSLSDPCKYMGLYVSQFDATRAVGKDIDRKAPNLVRQDVNTEGSFGTAQNNFLEIVAGPIHLPD